MDGYCAPHRPPLKLLAPGQIRPVLASRQILSFSLDSHQPALLVLQEQDEHSWCAPDCLQLLLHIQSSNFTAVGAREVYLHFKMRALVAVARGAMPHQCVPWSDTSFLCIAHSNAQITEDLFHSLCSCDFRSKALKRQKEHVNTCILILLLEKGAAFDSDPGQLHPAYLRFSICRRRDQLVWFAQVLQRFILSWIQTTIS